MVLVATGDSTDVERSLHIDEKIENEPNLSACGRKHEILNPKSEVMDSEEKMQNEPNLD